MLGKYTTQWDYKHFTFTKMVVNNWLLLKIIAAECCKVWIMLQVNWIYYIFAANFDPILYVSCCRFHSFIRIKSQYLFGWLLVFFRLLLLIKIEYKKSVRMKCILETVFSYCIIKSMLSSQEVWARLKCKWKRDVQLFHTFHTLCKHIMFGAWN